MYPIIKEIHSGWAYLVLIFLIIAVVNALAGLAGKKEFRDKDRKLALFALILAHTQLVFGIILYFTAPYFDAAKQLGMGAVMKNSSLRLYVVEHPLINIIAIVLITIGWSKHKKAITDHAKFKTIGLLYGIALLLFLSRIPWSAWL